MEEMIAELKKYSTPAMVPFVSDVSPLAGPSIGGCGSTVRLVHELEEVLKMWTGSSKVRSG